MHKRSGRRWATSSPASPMAFEADGHSAGATTWVVNDQPPDRGVFSTNPKRSATVDLTGANLTSVPVSITTSLFAFSTPSLGDCVRNARRGARRAAPAAVARRSVETRNSRVRSVRAAGIGAAFFKTGCVCSQAACRYRCTNRRRQAKASMPAVAAIAASAAIRQEVSAGGAAVVVSFSEAAVTPVSAEGRERVIVQRTPDEADGEASSAMTPVVPSGIPSIGCIRSAGVTSATDGVVRGRAGRAVRGPAVATAVRRGGAPIPARSASFGAQPVASASAKTHEAAVRL